MKTRLTPAQIDQHVGARIRMRRRQLGVSQEALAAPLAITFQQIQKYERGANRVSASKLYEIAAVLETTVDWFFAGLVDGRSSAVDDDGPARSVDDGFARFMLSRGAPELVATWPDIPPSQQTALLNLARAMAAPADDDADPVGPSVSAASTAARALHS